MATDEDILAEVEADWQELRDKIFKGIQDRNLDLSGIIPAPLEDFPWTEEDLFKRKIDYEAINEFINKLPIIPPAQELDELINDLTSPRHDPEIYLSVIAFPSLLEKGRRYKVEKLNRLKKKLSPLKNIEIPDGLLKSVSFHAELARSSSIGALRRIDIYLEFLEKKKPPLTPFAGNGTKTTFRKKVFSDPFWEYIFGRTVSFFRDYSEGEHKHYSACRNSVIFISKLFPGVFWFHEVDVEADIVNMTNLVYNRLSKTK